MPNNELTVERRGRRFHVVSESTYLAEKYGTPLTFRVEGTDREVFGKSWMDMNGNPAAMLYGMRSGMERLPWGGAVYYGKIGAFGELLHESELGAEVVEPS